MKKIFTLFTLFILSMSMAMQAQLLSAINDTPEGGELQISGRNNAPQATNWTFSWVNDYSSSVAPFTRSSGCGSYSVGQLTISTGIGKNGTIGYPAVTFYLGYLQLGDYGRVTMPPVGTYTFSSSYYSCGDFANKIVSYSGNSTYSKYFRTSSSGATNFTSGQIKIEAGRHGYPYIKTMNNINGTYNITIGDSRDLTTTYTSCRVATDEENGKAVLQAYDGTNTLTLVFNITSVDANIGIPAKQYTVGTDVWGGCTDNDGYTRWMFKNGGRITISKSSGKLSMSTSSLKGTSSGSDFDMNLTISSKAPNKTFTKIDCPIGMLGSASQTLSGNTYYPQWISGYSEDEYTVSLKFPYTNWTDIEATNTFSAYNPQYGHEHASSSNYITTPSNTTLQLPQGVACIDYTDEFRVAEVTTAYFVNNTFYYVHLTTNQVSSTNDVYLFKQESSSTFNQTFDAVTPDYDTESKVAHVAPVYGTSAAMDLYFYVDDTKDGVLPTGSYLITATQKENTALLGTTYSNNFYGSVASTSSYWLVRHGRIDVVNVNETYYIASNSVFSSHAQNMNFTIGTAPKDVTLTTPAANGTAKIQFTATNWNNKVIDYASGTAHKFFQNQTIALTATPASGFRVRYWTLGGTKINGSEYQNTYNYTVGSGATQTIAAVFEQYYTATITEPTNGTITVTYTNDLGSQTLTSGSASIAAGTSLTISAEGIGDYELDELTVNTAAFTSGETHTLNADATIAATFKQAITDYNLGEWNANGGTIKTAGTEAGRYAADTELTAPELNTRTGYTFNKWRDVTNGVDFNGYMPANDVTYTAQWNIVTYNLTYNGLNGESNTNPVSYNIESNDITLVAPGTRTGYTFANWTDDDNSAAVVTGIAKGSTGDRNFTATWTPNENTPYVVKHYQQNLTLDGYTEVEGDRQNLTGTTAASTAAEAKSYTGFTAQSFSQGTIAADGTTVVSIYYNRNLFTITWKNGTTTLETDENVPYGATPSYDGENPTKDADASYTYDFNTWSPAVAAVEDNATYSATFTSTPVEYTITFHSNGGSIPMNLVYTVEYEDIELPTAEDMTKDNHTFAGWYDNSSLEGDAVTVVANGSTGNKEFWAKWTLNGFMITFNDYDGTQLQSSAVVTNQKPTIASNPTRADDEENNIAYSFIGWKSSADENVYTTANLPVATAVVTYTAQYEPYFLIRDDKENNDAYYGALAAQAGKTLDVKYKRTFPKGRWSTLSLPFAYSFRTNIDPFDGKLYYLISANYTADGYLTLNCMPVTTGIEANKAYILILGEEDENIVNPTFKGAKMKGLEHKYYTAPNVDGIGNGVIFRNTIERETLEKDKRVIYLSGNRLYYPNLAPEASSWIYPFRGYFYLNIAEGQIQYSPARVRLVNEEGETIETLPEASEETSAEVKKYIENGILVIERAGIKYDAQGHIIK